jgi:magnesium transporter
MVAAVPVQEQKLTAAEGVRAILYDADGSDQEVEIDGLRPADLKAHQLLWVDVQTDGDGAMPEIWEWLELEPETYQRLYARLEKAIESLDTAREMVLGSFEIFMTRTAQHTSNVVKVLTVVSVLLLPALVVAGIMGMNFRVGLFQKSVLFWVTIAGMATLAVTTLVVARWRGWI